jgi:DNA-binding PadR family transcriptional regulator
MQDEFRERSLRSFLDVAILARLEANSVNGYGLTVFFMKKFGVIMSTSTVYSTLYTMERNGLVKCRRSWNGRVYELTEKGKEALKDSRNRLELVPSFIRTLVGRE